MAHQQKSHKVESAQRNKQRHFINPSVSLNELVISDVLTIEDEDRQQFV